MNPIRSELNECRLAYFVFGEKVTKRSAIALALIGAGSVAIIM